MYGFGWPIKSAATPARSPRFRTRYSAAPCFSAYSPFDTNPRTAWFRIYRASVQLPKKRWRANPPVVKYHRRFKSAENRALEDASGQRQCRWTERAIFCGGLPQEKSPAAAIAPTDGSVGALQGRRLAGGPTPRLQLVTSQATSAEAFSEISDYSSDGAQTESSLHSQPLPQSLSSLHAVAEHVALTAPPRRALRMRKAIFSARA